MDGDPDLMDELEPAPEWALDDEYADDLNDDTFGAGAAAFDWEANHEKLAELHEAEAERVRREVHGDLSPRSSPTPGMKDNTNFSSPTLESAVSRLLLDDPSPKRPTGNDGGRVAGVLSLEELEARMPSGGPRMAPAPMMNQGPHMAVPHPGMMMAGRGGPFPMGMPPPGMMPPHMMPPMGHPGMPMDPAVLQAGGRGAPQRPGPPQDPAILQTLGHGPASGLLPTPQVGLADSFPALGSNGQQQPQQQGASAPAQGGHPNLMTNGEIDGVIRQHLGQLTVKVPYLEDYYSQALSERRTLEKLGPGRGVTISATQVFQVLSDRMFDDGTGDAHGQTPFALRGVLGRTTALNVRAPRPLLQMYRNQEEEDKENSEGGEKSEKAEDSKPRSNSLSKAKAGKVDEDIPSVSPWFVRCSIEAGLECLIDIEDITRALGAQITEEWRNRLLAKRAEYVTRLFSLVRCGCGDANEDMDEQTLGFDFGFFIRLVLAPKGRRLLLRSMPLLSVPQTHALVFGYLRGLCELPKREEALSAESDDPDSLERFITRLSDKLQEMEVPFALKLIETFFENIGDSISIGDILETKSGAFLVTNVFKRCLSAPKEKWSAFYDKLFDGIKGRFVGVMARGESEGGSKHHQDFLLFIAQHATPAQRDVMLQELSMRS